MFESMEEVEQYLLDQVKDCLYNEIADEAEHAVQRHIETDVYDAYDPSVYERRNVMRSGRFLDRYLNGYELTILDNTPGNTPVRGGYQPSGTDLSTIISTGAQGHGRGLWKGAFARPYMKGAQEDVVSMVGPLLRKRLT